MLPHMQPMSDEQKIAIVNDAFDSFRGSIQEYNSAVGVFFLGFQLGWKPLYLMHSRNSIKKYEKILGVQFQEIFPPVGDKASRSYAWSIAENVSNFWKAVKGEIKGMRSPKIL